MKIGVDLGGTRSRVALVNERGHISAQSIMPTCAQRGAQAVSEQLVSQILALEGWSQADFVGVGVPGGVTRDGESLAFSNNLYGMDGFPLKRMLQQALGREVQLLNDANAACLGESLLGAGQGYESVAYITVSTGIGGGFFESGRLLLGAHGLAGEVACVSVDPRREPVAGLPPGAAESELSGTALVRRAHTLTGRCFAHAGEVFAQAVTDAALRSLVVDFVQGLAVLLSDLASMLDPGCFVLGGGCMQSHAFFWEALLGRYRDFALPVYRDTPILCASLAEPGLVGAALAQRIRA